MKRIKIVLSMLSLALIGPEYLLALGGTNPVPLINEPLVPAAVAPGGSAFTLTINGTGFVSASVVNWNGTARATVFVSTSQLTASISASDVATASTASVTVVNPTPGGGVSNVAFLQVTTAAETVVLGQSAVLQSPTVGGRQAVGDFNQDGKLDLAATDFSGVWILLGNGDGTFQAPFFNAVGSTLGGVVLGDFNGDGKLDVAGLRDGTVTILLGNGAGSFQPPIATPIDASLTRTSWLAAGDFNHDGKLDLVVGNQSGNAVTVLLGNGDGTFQPFVDYATGPEPTAVVIGDFNGDGNLDLATANFGSFGGNTVSILLGNGDGTFKPHVEYSTTDHGPLSLLAADFNGDGKLDLAVDCSCGHSSVCGRPGTVAVLLGNGDGTFKPAVIYDADQFPYTVTVGDFNGDGKLDLALTDLDSAKISFLLGNGDGTFQPHFDVPLLNSNTGVSGGPVGLVTGDFNGDGLLDLVTNNTSTSGQHLVDLLLQMRIATSTTLSADVNPVLAGSSVTFTAAVATVAASSMVPTGSVTFHDGATALGTITLDNAGHASLKTSSLSVGTHSITAVYEPSGGFAGSTSAALAETVQPIATSTMLSVDVNPVLTGSSVTFTAAVATVPASSMVPTGSVTFNDGTTALGTVTLDNTSHASLKTSSLTAGAHSITAVYAPSGDFAGSTSAALAENVEDFSLSSNPTSATVTAGNTASYTLSVTPTGGFNQAVLLSCTGAPTLATCTVSPASVTLDGTNAKTATVQVTTKARSMLAPRFRFRPPAMGRYRFQPLLLWLLGFALVASLLAAMRRRVRLGFAMIVFLVLLAAACGGGGGGNTPTAPSGTPSGTSTLTVTGTSGSLSHKATVTLTVN
jgi:Bacterial Ig-like domain (group 3)/FG-GAP-like repeat